jgi:hypothetical protein
MKLVLHPLMEFTLSYTDRHINRQTQGQTTRIQVDTYVVYIHGQTHSHLYTFMSAFVLSLPVGLESNLDQIRQLLFDKLYITLT